MSEEKKPITVLTAEIISEVPEKSKENVIFLTEQLKPSDLAEFNPVVAALNDLKKIKDIKYDPDDKKTVQAFKDAKKEIGSFNSSVTAAHKALKNDYLKITRGLDAIKRTFHEESDEIKQVLFDNFEEHLEAEKKKKEERERKKNAAREAEMKKLEEENAAQKLQVDRQNIYNNIKYDIISAAKNNSIGGLNSLSLDSVKRQIQNFLELSYDKEIVGHFKIGTPNYLKLTEEQDKELRLLFRDTYNEIIKLYKERRDELQIVEDNRMKSEREKGQLEGFERVVPQSKTEDLEPLKIKNEPFGPPAPPSTSKTTFGRMNNGATEKDAVAGIIEKLKSFQSDCNQLKNLIQDDSLIEIVLNVQALTEKAYNHVKPKFDKL